jgi:hypothetical protein
MRPQATSVCGLKLLLGVRVFGLKLLMYEALSRELLVYAAFSYSEALSY